MDSISQTLRTLRFTMSASKVRSLFIVISLLLVMILLSSLMLFIGLLQAGSLFMSLIVSLSFVIVACVIMGRLTLNWIKTQCLTCLQRISLSAVLSMENSTVFRFSMPNSLNSPFLEIDWPSEKVTVYGFVPDFVIYHCLIKCESYAKENEQRSR